MNAEMTPVLWVTLTFDRGQAIAEDKADRHYQNWMSKLAERTRCCLDAIAGTDARDKHAHLKVRCLKSDRERFFRNLHRFDVGRSWPHKHINVKVWDEQKASIDDSYIIKKHTEDRFCGCGNVRKPCRKGRCTFGKHNT